MRTQYGVLLDRGGNFYDIGSGCGKVVRGPVGLLALGLSPLIDTLSYYC
jgi:hypothetical protein